MPRESETVKMLSHETVHGNRIKLVATEKAFNSQKCLIILYIVGWVNVLIMILQSNEKLFLKYTIFQTRNKITAVSVLRIHVKSALIHCCTYSEF